MEARKTKQFKKGRIEDHVGVFFANRRYCISLYEYCLQLEEVLSEQTETIAKGGNIYYQKDAQRATSKYFEALENIASLKEKMTTERLEFQSEINELKIENERLKMELEKYKSNEKPAAHDGKKRDKSGRFVSSIPEAHKLSEMSRMNRAGYSNAQIAKKFGVSEETVKRYLRKDREESLKTANENEGEQSVTFDGETIIYS